MRFAFGSQFSKHGTFARNRHRIVPKKLSVARKHISMRFPIYFLIPNGDKLFVKSRVRYAKSVK
jgi:hypothetical protein